jgi:hypothetical protein
MRTLHSSAEDVACSYGGKRRSDHADECKETFGPIGGEPIAIHVFADAVINRLVTTGKESVNDRDVRP